MLVGLRHLYELIIHYRKRKTSPFSQGGLLLMRFTLDLLDLIILYFSNILFCFFFNRFSRCKSIF